MPKHSDVFVFDADDTLWMTEWKYSEAYAIFFAYLYEIMGDRMPNLHRVRDTFFEIEGGLYQKWGIRRGRVAEAMVLTYRKVCEWVEWRFDENPRSDWHESRIIEIGDMPFNYKRLRYLAGVENVLTELSASGARLHMLTSFDAEVFPAKAEFLGISRWFSPERVRVIPGKKTIHDFVAVSGWEHDTHRHERRWFAVGNGETDIRPALDIAENWRGVFIPQGSTSQFFNDDKSGGGFTAPALDHPRVTTIKDFRDLPGAVKG